MPAIGLFSDSDGDLEAFDAALRLLAEKGARRFMFSGNRYADLDEWLKWKRELIKGQADYSNADFLEDVQRYLIGLEQAERPAAFGTAWEFAREVEALMRLRERILRTPEKGSLQYQDSSVPRKVVDLLGDTLYSVVYDKNDFDKEDMVNSLVLVHGKELEPKLVQIGPRYFVTPGRLKGGKQSTVGLLDLTEKQLSFSAFTLDGKMIIDHQPIGVAAKTKITVK